MAWTLRSLWLAVQSLVRPRTSYGRDTPLPARLYKYTSLEAHHLARARNIIVDREVYFANPATFNDPFECRFRFSMNGTAAEWNQFLRRPEVAAENGLAPGAEPTAQQMARWKSNALAHAPTVGDKFRANMQKDVGLLCLSEERDHILLWSHYANSHRGVCFGFSVADDPLFAQEITKVTYQDDFPIYEYFNPPEDVERIVFSTKSSQWSYEAEWRVIRVRMGEGEGAYRFAPGTLRDVILGSEISKSDRQSLEQYVAKAPAPPIALWVAERVQTQYALTIKRV